jgi:anti-sigma factor RsiW
MTMTCHDAARLLDDALDGIVAPDDAAALATHLEGCPVCRDLQADIALIREASAALDRPIAPAHGWTTLAAQLEREGLLAAAPARRTPWSGYAWMALAATLLAGVGGGLIYRASERVAPPAPAASASSAPSTPAPGNAGDARAVEAIEIELRLAAEHYEKAIAALEGLAAEDRTRLDPAVSQVVARNLVLIDQAIADSRQALQGQPGSLVAQESLFDAYRRKVSLLQDLIAMAGEARRTGSEAVAPRERPRS